MCSTPKMNPTPEVVEVEKEVIKEPVQADVTATSKKADAKTRLRPQGLVSDNIKTTNNGIEDEIISSKKKLLGE